MVLNVRVRACPDRTSEESGTKGISDPLPLRGVPRRGEGCNRSARIIVERTSKSHPPSLRDTSPPDRCRAGLEGGDFTHPVFASGESTPLNRGEVFLPSFLRRGHAVSVGVVDDLISDPLPLRGVPRRGEVCNRSARIIVERTSKSHPPSLRDTSLEGGDFAMTLIFLSCILHLNLKVLKLIIAERIPIIQNRTTIFDSSIPFNSK